MLVGVGVAKVARKPNNNLPSLPGEAQDDPRNNQDFFEKRKRKKVAAPKPKRKARTKAPLRAVEEPEDAPAPAPEILELEPLHETDHHDAAPDEELNL